MGRKPMREWIYIRHADPSGFKNDIDIFDASIKYIASLNK